MILTRVNTSFEWRKIPSFIWLSSLITQIRQTVVNYDKSNKGLRALHRNLQNGNGTNRIMGYRRIPEEALLNYIEQSKIPDGCTT